jgi:hypothetical protein
MASTASGRLSIPATTTTTIIIIIIIINIDVLSVTNIIVNIRTKLLVLKMRSHIEEIIRLWANLRRTSLMGFRIFSLI